MCKPWFSIGDFTEAAMRECFSDEDDMIDILRGRGFKIVAVEGEVFWEEDGYYAFLDRGADVLAVAHLDSVYDPTPPMISGSRLSSSAVDNRFGVYVILELLHRKGITADILFTTNEESCASTARFFTPPGGRVYNWMVSFDRMGWDAALYQFHQRDDGAWERALTRSGFRITRGTYADICDMSHIGCKGINVGIGYCEHAHSLSAWVDLDIAVDQLNRFKRFYDANCRRKFVHDPKDEFSLASLLLDMDFPSREAKAERSWADVERDVVRLVDRKRKEAKGGDSG